MKRHLTNRVFGYLILAGAGAFFYLGICTTLLDRVRMNDWQQVTAQVLQADLRSNRGNKGTTYRVTASYRYHYGGRTWTGTRIGHTTMSDNIGDWQQRMYHRLEGERRQGKAITVWVNPENPGEAIVDRDIRWGLLLFKGVFIGLFAALGCFLVWRGKRSARKAPTGTPEWLANPDWKDNRIRSTKKTLLWFYWAFALIWNLINIPVLLKAPELLAERSPFILMAFLFPVAGVLMIASAVAKTRQWRRYGAAPLCLEPFPGRIGGTVGGYIDVAMRPAYNTRANLTLTCMHAYQQHSGGKTRTVRKVKWQDQSSVSLVPGPHGARIAFRFSTPNSAHPTRRLEGGHDYWTLDVHIYTDGPDFVRQYLIPVFETDESAAVAPNTLSTDTGGLAALAEGGMEQRQDAPVIPASVLKTGYGPGGKLFTWLPRRNLKQALATLAGGLFLTGLIGILFVRTDVPLAMVAVFSGLGLFLIGYGILSLNHRRDVSVSTEKIRIRDTYYGIVRTRDIPVSQIRAIDKRVGAQAGGNGTFTASYSIHLTSRSGLDIRIGDNLPGASAAERVIADIRRAAQLDGHLPLARETGNDSYDDATMQGRNKRIRWLVQGVGAAVFLLLSWDFANRFIEHWHY